MRKLASLPCEWHLPEQLAGALKVERVPVEHDHYPDGESHIVVAGDVSGDDILLLANLHHPDEQSLPVLLLAETLRDLGAASVHLVAPYLPYMRQDKRFRPGEGVTSRYYAALLSRHFDSLTTVDPHLHRYRSLDEIYGIPGSVLHAAPLLARWIAEQVARPLLVGPDAESEQWVGEVARGADAPFVVGEKHRRGDRAVEVRLPDMTPWHDRTPVLVDDIISSGRTMIEAIRVLHQAGLGPVTCLGVHAVFAEPDYRALASQAQTLVTTDAIPHPSNGISLASLLATELAC